MLNTLLGSFSRLDQDLLGLCSGLLHDLLCRGLGLPTATETQALQAEVHALSKELRSLATGLPIRNTERKVVTKLDARRKLLQVKKMQGNGVVNQTLAAA